MEDRKARVLAFASQKGGAAKTTTCWAFADALVADGYKVLCVDMDPQDGNLSLVLQADRDELNGTAELIGDVLGHKQIDPEDYIQHLRRCDVIAASSSLIGTIVELTSAIGRESKLRRGLAPMLGSYDFILIDTPGNLEILTLNALVAADDVIIPTSPDLSSASGARATLRAIYAIRDECNPDLRVAGVALTNYKANTNLHREFADTIAALCEAEGVRLFDTRVRQSIKASEAQSYGRDLGSLNEGSTVDRGIVRDYKDLVGEYLATI